MRIELLRLRRLPGWLAETPRMAWRRGGEADLAGYRVRLARHESPLRRAGCAADPILQAGKERNVALAAGRIDGIVVGPGKVFSYHRAVGRPSRLRGFRPGPELHDGRLSQGIGGGCCQVSNLLYLLALCSGMKIIERHRHGVDMFPDHGRTVPFGCGATVFYNYADLRFENPLDRPVALRLRIAGSHLVGEVWTDVDPGWTIEVYEADAQRYRDGDAWIRENRVRRRICRDGAVLSDEEVAHNRARVLYAQTEEGEPAMSPPISLKSMPCFAPR
ncbi:MAG TPA: VanW family protein [Chthonomonadaceae bacterium]|nr:VanW family protein [Chthonomonadaceae bacterium]